MSGGRVLSLSYHFVLCVRELTASRKNKDKIMIIKLK